MKPLSLGFVFLLGAVLLFSACALYTPQPTQSSPDPSIPTFHVYDSLVDMEEEAPPLSLEERRQLVVAEMREMMTLLWTPQESLTYYITGLEENPVAISLEAGRIYQGMPYTNGGASRYSFLSYATHLENGVYTLSGLTWESLSGTKMPRLGNSCSSALSWAWGRVSSSLSFSATNEMTAFFGCLPVGDYTAPDYKYGTIKSTDICQQNGESLMYKCYAQMLPGDGLITRNGAGGHAVMASEVNVVYRDDGSVDESTSTVTILDQNQLQELAPIETYLPDVGYVMILQKVDQVRSFAWLYESGYLPITCKELIDPSPLTPAAVTDYTDAPTTKNMFLGYIQATHHISSVTVSIIDAQGNLVQKSTCYGIRNELNEFSMHRFIAKSEAPARQGTIDLNALPAGTYRCIFTCRLSTGDNLTFRDFTFDAQ